MKIENDILEKTFYFLACLAGGANMPELALACLRKAIQENNWWYRPDKQTAM